MAVTVEELEIVVRANIKDALAGMTQLKTQLRNILSAQIPNISAQLSPVKQIVDQYGGTITASAAKTQSAVKQTGDKVKQTVQSTQQAVESVKKTLTAVADPLKNINMQIDVQKQKMAQLQSKYESVASGKGTDSAPALNLQNQILKVGETIDRLTAKAGKMGKSLTTPLDSVKAKVKEAADEYAYLDEVIQKALGKQSVSSNSLPTSAARIPTALASQMPAVASTPVSSESVQAPQLSGWQRFTAQYRTYLDNAKSALNKFGLYGKESVGQVKNYTDAATTATKKYGNQVRDTTSKSNSLFGSLGQTIKRVLVSAVIYQGFRKLFDFIKSGLQSAIDAPEIENLFRVALGNMSNQAAAFADKLKTSLGIDQYATKQMMGTFQNLSTSMGIGQKTAYSMSQSLTMLANDMASLYNVDPEQASENLQSALTGQGRAVRKYGMVITESTIQQTAWKYGLAKTGAELTEQQKVIARYLTLVDQSKNAQGDMARTIGSVQNQLRILKQNFEAAGRSIGGAFIPFIQAAVPWLNAFMVVMQRVGVALSRWTYSLFGKNYDEEMKKQQAVITGYNGIADSEDAAGTAAADAAKKAKGALADFDEIKVIDQPDKSKSKSGSGTGSGGLDFNVPTLDVSKTTSPIEAMADKMQAAFDGVKSHIPQAAIDNFRLSFDKLRESWGLLYGTLQSKDFFSKWGGLVSGNVLNSFTNLNLVLSGLAEAIGGIIQIKPEKVLNGVKDALLGILSFPVDASTNVIDFWFGTHLAESWQKVKQKLIELDFEKIFSSIQTQGLGDNVSASTQIAIKAFDGLYKNADKDLKQLEWSGDTVTKSMADKINKNVQGMADQTVAGFNRQRDESIKAIQELSLIKGGLSKKEADEIIKNVNEGYNSRIKTEQDGQSKIQKILDDASTHHRGLTKSESDEINTIKSKMYDSGVKALSKNQVEEQAIFDNMRINHTATSAQEAADIVKNSKTTTDKVIADANQTYKERVAAIIRERDETHTISSDQADKLIQAAGKERDESVKAAEDKHQKVVAEAQKQSGECVDQVDWATGQVKSKWSVMWDTIKDTATTKWNEITDFFIKELPKWWNTNVAPWTKKEKWEAEFDHVRQAAQAKWQEVKDWWNNTAIVKWWNNDVAPWFTAKKWEDMMAGVKEGFKATFKNAVNGAIAIFNKFIDWVNERMHFQWDDIKVAGKTVAKGGSVQLFTIPTIPQLATGGVLKQSTLFNGGEYAGAVTNPEIVTPQKIMYDTVVSANGPLMVEVLNAIEELKEAVVTVVNSKDLSFNFDGEQLERHQRPIRESENSRIGGTIFQV